jgi:putative nucleotidyltransferase with HDIG domain
VTTQTTRPPIEVIQRLLEGAGDLPVLPDMAAKILEQLRSPTVTAPRLAEFVKKDPVLASSILRVANSALYGGRVEITDLAFAMTRIGLNQARNLVFANVLRSKMADPQVYGAAGRQLMDHSLAVAFCSQMVADTLDIARDEAFLCGLLHDFGRLALIKVLRQTQGFPRGELGEDQQQLVDEYHTRAGAILAKSWGLPEVVALSARYHHEIAEASESGRSVVAIVGLSDAAAHALGIGSGRPTNNELDGHPGLELLCVSREEIDDVVASLPNLFQTARASMGA